MMKTDLDPPDVERRHGLGASGLEKAREPGSGPPGMVAVKIRQSQG
jgi:hypothetical protein